MSENVSKQEQVIEMVSAGKYTRDEIKEAVGCTAGSLASYLSTMSNIAKYSNVAMSPVTNEDGIMSVATHSEAEELKATRVAARPSAASKKTPAERFEAARKRVTRCENALTSAAARAEDNADSEEASLRRDLAEINLKLANLEYERCSALMDEVASDDDSNIEETDEDLL